MIKTNYISRFFYLLLIVAASFTIAACDEDISEPDDPETPEVPEEPEEPEDPKNINTVFAISIETENAAKITSKENYINCQVSVSGYSIFPDYEGSARIRGRGNSTWLWYDKKPYRIKLDEKSEILGLTTNKDWVLLANYRDPTHLMNAVGFETAGYLGLPCTNHTRFVNVILNGDYIGLYQLTEQVEVAKNRVDISDTKGYLLSLDLDDGPDLSPNAGDNFTSEVFRMPVCVKSPDDQTKAQLNAIKADFAQLETAINQYGYDAVDNLMDIQSLIDYLIIQEWVYNVEIDAPRSTYIHKDKDGKWIMGPVWDFDAGFDFDWTTMYTGHNYFASYKELVLGTDPRNHVGGYHVPDFFTQMFRNQRFVTEYKARWAEVSEGMLEHILSYIDETEAYTADAMLRDYNRWPINKQYKTEIGRMKTWFTNRTAYLTTVINGYK